MSLPNNPHEFALWLLDQLEELTNVGSHWEGKLPDSYNFEETLLEIPAQLLISSSSTERRIEFRPESVGVFQSLTCFLKGQQLRRVPQIFTIRDLSFTYGLSTNMPLEVQYYLDTVKLWSKLVSFAEYVKDKGTELLFIQSFDSQLWLVPDYTSNDLIALPNIDEFLEQYFEDKHHLDQKRNIVRAVLLEIFSDQRRAKLADILKIYQDFVDRVKSSYALYTNDFSFERLKSEVSKQNQDDILRLNKTFSDIQNQLLALPAALLAAGAGMKQGEWHVNLTILIGISIYSWFMYHLVENQQSSVNAIGAEIDLRKKKVAEQPIEISEDVVPLFDALSIRLERQKSVLKQVKYGVWLVFILSLVLVVRAHSPALISMLSQFIQYVSSGNDHFPSTFPL